MPVIVPHAPHYKLLASHTGFRDYTTDPDTSPTDSRDVGVAGSHTRIDVQLLSTEGSKLDQSDAAQHRAEILALELPDRINRLFGKDSDGVDIISSAAYSPEHGYVASFAVSAMPPAHIDKITNIIQADEHALHDFKESNRLVRFLKELDTDTPEPTNSIAPSEHQGKVIPFYVAKGRTPK
jgi:hypothetical protein